MPINDLVTDNITPNSVNNYQVKNISFKINNGQDFTYEHNVILDIYAENATEMQISNNNDFTDISWQLYQTKLNWNLLNKDEAKVYIRFKNSFNQISDTHYDEITVLESLEKNDILISDQGDNILFSKGRNAFVYVPKNNNINDKRLYIQPKQFLNTNTQDTYNLNNFSFKFNTETLPANTKLPSKVLVGLKYDKDKTANKSNIELYRVINNKLELVSEKYEFTDKYIIVNTNTLGEYIVGYSDDNIADNNYNSNEINNFALWLDNNVVRTFIDNAVYYIKDGKKHPFIRESDFFSWGHSWQNVIYVETIDNIDLGSPMLENDNYNLSTGSLVKGNDIANVYFINQQLEKAWIINEGIFNNLGFDFKKVISLSEAKINSIDTITNIDEIKRPNGSLVRYNNNDDIYFIIDNKKQLLPYNEFLRKGYDPFNIVTISEDEQYHDI